MNGFTITTTPTGDTNTSPAAARPPSGPPATLVHREGRFVAANGSDPAPMVMRESRNEQTLPSKEILQKFGATWAQDPPPAPEPGAKPAEITSAAAPAAAGAPPVAPVPEAGKDPAKPVEAAPMVPAADEHRAVFGERKAADVKAELDRYSDANRQLVADLEAARRAPPPTDDPGYDIDDSIGHLRRRIAKALGHEDPQHEDVSAELQALTLDLNAAVFGAPLDVAQKAARDAAKARQALARDKRSRTAPSDSSVSSEEAQTKKATEIIGNRLSATRTGPDGKALPSMREQFPLAAAMAQRNGVPLEQHIYEVYRRELPTGRFDPKRLHDDDYLISEAGALLESQYQVLADVLGKARPTPSTASPQPTPPASAPAAAASASQGPPQGHGGRTALTAADGSVAPATPPSAPAKPTKKLQSKDDFFSKWYPKS